MRSVLIHLRNVPQEQVEAFLARTFTRQHGPPWISDVAGDACLYIRIYRDLAIEFEPEHNAALRKELGCEPVSVVAEISGRHPGDQQVKDLVSKLLSEFEGVAEDEYTEGFWTLDEIRSEQRKPAITGGDPRGHKFFDHSSFRNLGQTKVRGS